MAIRLGAPLFAHFDDPDAWAQAHLAKGYRAAYCPVSLDAPDDTVQAFAQAAQRHDLVISEVGAWSNPLSPDEATAKAALEKCIAALDLAERIGANCAVNISGGCGEQWDGPHPNNLTFETFGRIVEQSRHIIDAVNPKNAFWTLEAMPWMYPTGPDEYLSLIRAIDRPQFGVHLDPVNMVNSPIRYARNADFIRECFALLGRWIKNCHAKDIYLSPKLTTHLDEVIPGRGGLDYGVFLQELEKLGNTRVALMLEHLKTEEEYEEAADYVRRVAVKENIMC
ncbi:MAG: TIM barrel protein [Armatimonas sp.]